MSHKKKNLTWYQLYLRIGKMGLTTTQKQMVKIKMPNGELKDVGLDYEENGTLAYLTVEENK